MNNPTLYIFVGYPGSGKTTLSKLIHEQTGAVHIWADHERHLEFSPVTYSHIESEALYNRLNSLCEQYLSEGKSVIYDTNFNFFLDRQLMRNIAKKHNANIRLIWMTTPTEVAKVRATTEEDLSDTRVFGIMKDEDFKRISNHLEKPHPDEKPLKIDGTAINESTLKQVLEN
ncbi:MAG TPA: ATP-binding protein [Candidatus Saccharimonadales bacterium]